MSANSCEAPSAVVGRVHHGADVFGRHAARDARRDVAIGGDGDVRCLLHERELGGRLHHAATAHHGRAVADIHARHGAPQAVHREESHGFLDGDRARHFAIAQDAGDGEQRILVLVPDAHFGGNLQALAHRGFFEVRRDDGDLALARQHGGGEPLAAPPVHAGEIDQRRAGLDEQRTDAQPAHERARLVDAREVFGAARWARRRRSWI